MIHQLNKDSNQSTIMAKLEELYRFAASKLSTNTFIRERQNLSLQKLSDIQLPSKKSEKWKYFDISKISQFLLNSSFNQINTEINEELKSNIECIIQNKLIPECKNSLLVTVDGKIIDEFCSLSPELEASLDITSFNKDSDLSNQNTHIKKNIEELFAKDIAKNNDFFYILNTLLFESVFYIGTKANTEVTDNIQILHISSNSNFNQIRSLIDIADNSKLNIMVNYVGIEESQHLTNAVIECNVSKGGKLHLDRIQEEDQAGSLLYYLEANLEANAEFLYNNLNLKATNSREDININLNGAGAYTDVSGLYLLNDNRKSHHIINVNHNVPHANSNQLFKGLLYDKSVAEFFGSVFVEKNAIQTNAEQLNQNLLVSDEAKVYSRPQLDIYNEDVKCSHGSTIGQMDTEELFYLQSRGLSQDDSIALITLNFCDEIIQKLNIESARKYARKLALNNLEASELFKI